MDAYVFLFVSVLCGCLNPPTPVFPFKVQVHPLEDVLLVEHWELGLLARSASTHGARFYNGD